MLTAEEARTNNKFARECEGLQADITLHIMATIREGKRHVEHYCQTSRFAVASVENILESNGYDFIVDEMGRFIEVRDGKNVTMVQARFEIEW